VTTDTVRVLFVHTATLPPLGADTWIHAQILKELDRSAYELHVACAPGTSDAPTPTFEILSQISDLHLHRVDFGPELFGRSRWGKVLGLLGALRALPAFARLAIFVRRQGVQIIHTSDRPRDAMACVMLARVTRAKCIIHAHVGYGDWMSPLLKWSLKRADALIVVSDFVGYTLVVSGHPSAKIHVVLNAIDPTDWIPGRGRDEARRELGLPPDVPVILTVCRLFPAKGPGELVSALPAIRKQYPDIRLLIVGQELVAGFQKQLEELARDLGVADNVIFTGRRSDVAKLMAAADIYAMPSLGEPFGLVFLEAMAMELPVVALDSGGAPEVVEDGTTGLLSKPGDGAALTEHLLSLLGDPERRRLMGINGRRRVLDYFTLARMAQDTANVYEQLTSRRTVASNNGRVAH
jgi:glycosyltransferase involved in cell wall biosynthesis